MRARLGMTPARFLARHWQRRPLFVRAAFPRFRDPVSSEDLFRLAARADVASRLVRRRGGPRPWHVQEGPLGASARRRLGGRDWTLLVREVDRHVEAAAGLLDAFAFLPAWRIDDVMVSVAAPGGGVGPHVDSYDVFLVQGRGRRRWRIDPHAGPEFRPGLDLRILKRFHPTEEWVLGPGDMLYLPPGVGHEGTALGDCLTYSIGFLAPTAAELGARALQRVVMTLGETRFGDPGRRRSAHPGEIGKADVARFAALLRAEMGDVRFADLPAVLGEHLSERRGDGPPARSTSAASVTRVLRAGGRLRRTPGARLVYVREREGAALLFAHGFGRRLSPALAFAAPLLADRRVPDPARVLEGLRRSGFPALVAELVSEGVFELRR